MVTDLVARLRSGAKMFQFSGNEEEELAQAATEAADRIEQLERDLAAARAMLSTAGSWIRALKPYASYESKETIENFMARIDAMLAAR